MIPPLGGGSGIASRTQTDSRALVERMLERLPERIWCWNASQSGIWCWSASQSEIWCRSASQSENLVLEVAARGGAAAGEGAGLHSIVDCASGAPPMFHRNATCTPSACLAHMYLVFLIWGAARAGGAGPRPWQLL